MLLHHVVEMIVLARRACRVAGEREVDLTGAEECAQAPRPPRRRDRRAGPWVRGKFGVAVLLRRRALLGFASGTASGIADCRLPRTRRCTWCSKQAIIASPPLTCAIASTGAPSGRKSSPRSAGAVEHCPRSTDAGHGRSTGVLLLVAGLSNGEAF